MIEIKFNDEAAAQFTWRQLYNGDIVQSVETGHWYVVHMNVWLAGLVKINVRDNDPPSGSFHAEHFMTDLYQDKKFFRLNPGESITVSSR